ncbi:MAG: D-alanyl-D-alanine carboxypeptidase [Hungatella sp.]|nr:D-alanyl-D-alanine carboxypeptidase [Hungatella sp.]
MGPLVKRMTSFFLCAAMALGGSPMTAYARPDWPSDTGIMAEAGIVMDMDSGTILFGQNIHVAYAPASITKLLTALVVVENSSLDDVVIFSHDAVYNVEAGSGNKLALEEGDQISVKDCLYMMMLLSSNQSANALAEHVAGSREEFVNMMNERIARLGCKESHFANPSGLNDTEQYVTAYDMALISAAAFDNETVLEISSTRRYTVGPTINNPEGANISMEHQILRAENSSNQFYCEGATAGKTGYTSIAGNTLVTYAKRDGRNLVSVILKGTKPQYYLDAKTILNFGFASFKNESVPDSENLLTQETQLEHEGTTYPSSRLRLEDSVISLPAGAQFSDADRSLVWEMPGDHPEGAVAMVQYSYNERKVGSAYIYDTQLEAELAAAQASREAEEASREAAEREAAQKELDGLETEEETAEDRDQEKKPEDSESGFRLGENQILILAAAAGVMSVAAAGVFVVVRRRRRERLARELRRQRRRRRLEEIGFSEEDFEQMVRSRQEKRRSQGKKENEYE